MAEPHFVPLDFERMSADEQRRRLTELTTRLARRRSVRAFATRPGAAELVRRRDTRAAGTAPSGANLQPWHFVLVESPEVKRKIREAAEAEERESYRGRMPEEWLARLAPLGTDEHKPYLEIAPYLIVVFKEEYGIELAPDGAERKIKHYYVSESVGIACGFLIAALHVAGLATLTHTPSPMGFLSEILGMPRRYKPFLLLPVGYPAPDARVPDITKKPLAEILTTGLTDAAEGSIFVAIDYAKRADPSEEHAHEQPPFPTAEPEYPGRPSHRARRRTGRSRRDRHRAARRLRQGV